MAIWKAIIGSYEPLRIDVIKVGVTSGTSQSLRAVIESIVKTRPHKHNRRDISDGILLKETCFCAPVVEITFYEITFAVVVNRCYSVGSEAHGITIGRKMEHAKVELTRSR